jgi:type IV fimbrial biogenesis protein FimT
MRAARGMTLMELIATLAVVGIATSLAAPTFAEMQRNAARTAAVNDFFHAIFLARSEAIKRGTIVTICKSPDGERCASDHPVWSDGYLVFANTDHDEPAEVDPNEEVLQVSSGWTSGRITANRDLFSFRPHTQAVVNGTILFCDDRGADHARAIIISQTGRPRISPRDASQRSLQCG